MKHQTRMFVLLSCLSVPFALAEDPAGHAGGTTPALYVHSTGEVAYQGVQIKYYYATIRTPTAESSSQPEGSVLAFLPILDHERDDTGSLIMKLQEPVTGKPIEDDPRTFAQKVWDGKIDPEVKVVVTFSFRLHSDEILKKAILNNARSQIHVRVDGNDKVTAPRGDEILRAVTNVIMLPVQAIRLVPQKPSVEGAMFAMEDYPTMKTTVWMSETVPARFISHLFCPSGVAWRVEYRFDVAREGDSQLWGRRVANDTIDVFLEAAGGGGLEYRGDHNHRNVKVLVRRDVLKQISHESAWRDTLIIRGGSQDDINAFLGLFQRNDLDVFTASQTQVDEFLRNDLGWLDILKKPGIAQSLQDAMSKENLTEKDVQRYMSVINALATESRGGGALSIAGIFSLGGGGGKARSSLDATKKEDREFFRNFLRSISQFAATGSFPVHADGGLSIVSNAAINRAFDTHYRIGRSGPVVTILTTDTFSSARPSLKKGLPDEIQKELLRARTLEVKQWEALKDAFNRNSS